MIRSATIVLASLALVSFHPSGPVAEAAAAIPFLQTGNEEMIVLGPNAGPGSIYPSDADVRCTGTIVDVDLFLNGLSHAYPDDIDLLLVGPDGRSATVMSDVGGQWGIFGRSLRLDDEASAALPDDDLIGSGPYRPTDVESGDAYPAPAPVPSGGPSLSVFDGASPVGTWRLFAVDDESEDAGELEGWSLLIRVERAGATDICIPPRGRADPYGAVRSIAGHSGKIVDVDVRLDGVSHGAAHDLDVLLSGPGGTAVLLASDAGGANELANASLTFDDEADAALPEGSPIVSGAYRPTDHGGPSILDIPAPAATASDLAGFDGRNPNSDWRLWVHDDTAPQNGVISSWSLELTTLDGSKARAREGSPLAFRLTRKGDLSERLVLRYRTKGRGARPGADFRRSSGRVVFPPGRARVSVKVPTIDDPRQERAKEKLLLRVKIAPKRVLWVRGLIRDDDRVPDRR